MDKTHLSYLLRRIKNIIFPPVKIHAPLADMIIERDVRVPLRDQVHLSVDVFRPNDSSSHPVIICFHPYKKTTVPKKRPWGYSPPISYRILRQTGQIHYSALTGWEAPDPDFWVQHGYVLINADMRGAGKSEGTLNLLSDEEGRDYYDLIEWAAAQSWSNKKVGLCGVSYLALSQYRAAALQPPHLAAICPWEGFSDIYKDLARPGGIREDKFFPFWSKMVNPDLRQQQIEHVTRDAWWQSRIPEIHNITVPALICGSFSDQCLHTGGSFRVFLKIQSEYKWLYTHRSGKWATFYSEEALAMQLKFFDHFLKGEANDLLSIPRVRLEVRENSETIHSLSHHSDWPLAKTQWTTLYLNVPQNTLQETAIGSVGTQCFNVKDGELSLTYTFTQDAQLVGPMKLKVHLKVDGAQDINLFAGLRKFHQGNEVFFEGSYGYGFDIVSKGWQKASLRQVDMENSTFWHPEHPFLQQEYLNSGSIVCLELELLPSATFFRKNDVLRLDLQGHWFFKPSLLWSQLSNYESSGQGQCTVYSGAEYDSYLLIPVVPLS